jgi:hypothetical protein
VCKRVHVHPYWTTQLPCAEQKSISMAKGWRDADEAYPGFHQGFRSQWISNLDSNQGFELARWEG